MQIVFYLVPILARDLDMESEFIPDPDGRLPVSRSIVSVHLSNHSVLLLSLQFILAWTAVAII